MGQMRLTKYHGLGNDFLVLSAPSVPTDAASLARRVCHRHTGIGADGLLVLTPSNRPGIDAVMSLFNADGSIAEISGNGIRCVAHAIVRDRGATAAALVIETLAGDRELVVQPGGSPTEVLVRVDMGAARPGPELAREPVAPSVVPRRAATYDIGNPHLVVLVDDPDSVDLAHDGPLLERDYAGGMNVHFIAPAPDGSLTLRVWERGAGITEACGSGAVVAALAAHEWGLVADHVIVRMPGGQAEVVVADQLTLVGPSEYIASVEILDV
jgi:diaminopimelate epimerase